MQRFILMSALGTQRAQQGSRALLPREVGGGARGRGLGNRAHDLPPELHLWTRRRHAPGTRLARALVQPVTPVVGDEEVAADLGRGRGGLLQEGPLGAGGREQDVRARRAPTSVHLRRAEQPHSRRALDKRRLAFQMPTGLLQGQHARSVRCSRPSAEPETASRCSTSRTTSRTSAPRSMPWV